MVETKATLFRNAQLVGLTGRYDVTVQGRRISHVTPVNGHSVRADAQGDAIDLSGDLWLAPSLLDSHVHFTAWALNLQRIDLTAAKSAARAVELVRAGLDRFAPDAVVVGRDFRVGSWPDIQDLTKETLDAAFPDRAVCLLSGDLHSSWSNTLGLRHLGVDPVGHSGVLVEKEAFEGLKKLNAVPDAELDDIIRLALRDAASKGVTEIVELEMQHNLPIWTKRIREKEGMDLLKVHCGMYEEHVEDAVSDFKLKTGDTVPSTRDLVVCGPYKIITDGSLGTRTAFCHEPYPHTDDHGLWIYPNKTLAEMARYGTKHGLRMAIHAIGDKANSETLDVLESLGIDLVPGSSIEHAQQIRWQDLDKFKRLGMVASIQPSHILDDIELCERFWCGRPLLLLQTGRTERAFPYKAFVDAGIKIRLGSDAPVAALDPWQALAAAISRSRPGKGQQSWHPEQIIDIRTAWEASTSSGTVSLVEGGAADLVVLGRDPLTASAQELREMPVLGTMLGGRWTYRTTL